MSVQIKRGFQTSVAVLLLMFLILPGRSNAGESMVLASIPWQKATILKEIYQPLVQLLANDLGMEIQFLVTKDYMELAKRLDTGAADIGIFGGNSYVEARESFPGIRYIATCMQPTDHYRSLIVVRKDSSIRDLHDLAGKSFAFTDKGSTSGYIYPRLMMMENGIDPEKDVDIIYFLEKHDKVYDAVAKGIIDAGGVTSTALERAIERNTDVFRIIATSDPIPRNAVVAGPHLSEERIDRIRESLISASERPEFKDSPSILKGFAVRSDRFYDSVRKARKIKH